MAEVDVKVEFTELVTSLVGESSESTSESTENIKKFLSGKNIQQKTRSRSYRVVL